MYRVRKSANCASTRVTRGRVGTFKSAPKSDRNADPISLRGSQLHSSTNDSYSAYLANALKQELSLAEKYSETSTTEVTGTLQKNDLNAAGFSQGEGEIEARFVVSFACSTGIAALKRLYETQPDPPALPMSDSLQGLSHLLQLC